MHATLPHLTVEVHALLSLATRLRAAASGPWRCLGLAVHVATLAAASGWAPDNWKVRPARQIPDAAAPGEAERALASFPPLVFAGEARKLEERLEEAAMGRAFLL